MVAIAVFNGSSTHELVNINANNNQLLQPIN